MMVPMTSHVALLRAVNVGGGGKIAMAELRGVVASLGHTDVSTYIQTGNVIFTPAGAATGHPPDAIAAGLRAAITARFGLDAPVVVLSRDGLAAVVAENPYPAAEQPRYLHAVFLTADPDPQAAGQVQDAVAAAARAGSGDTATLLRRTLYLYTPGGFGTSLLARALLGRRSSPVADGTARNWNTVTKLLALCGS